MLKVCPRCQGVMGDLGCGLCDSGKYMVREPEIAQDKFVGLTAYYPMAQKRHELITSNFSAVLVECRCGWSVSKLMAERLPGGESEIRRMAEAHLAGAQVSSFPPAGKYRCQACDTLFDLSGTQNALCPNCRSSAVMRRNEEKLNATLEKMFVEPLVDRMMGIMGVALVRCANCGRRLIGSVELCCDGLPILTPRRSLHLEE